MARISGKDVVRIFGTRKDLHASPRIETQQAKQEVFGADVPVQQAIGFFGGVVKNALGFFAERYLDGHVDRASRVDRLARESVSGHVALTGSRPRDAQPTHRDP